MLYKLQLLLGEIRALQALQHDSGTLRTLYNLSGDTFDNSTGRLVGQHSFLLRCKAATILRVYRCGDAFLLFIGGCFDDGRLRFDLRRLKIV